MGQINCGPRVSWGCERITDLEAQFGGSFQGGEIPAE